MDTNNEKTSRRSRSNASADNKPVEMNQGVDENTIISTPIRDDQNKAAGNKAGAKNEDANMSRKANAADTRGGKGNKTTKKPPKGRVRARRIWIAFMAITVITAIIVGIVAVIYFFWEPEASPVYGIDNASYRLKDRPALDSKLFTETAEQMKGETSTVAIEIEERGGIVYFNITVPNDRWIGHAKEDATKIVNKFVENSGNPDLFKKYEAQVIIMKETPDELSTEAMLKDPTSKDDIHAYPSFGTANKGTDGQLKWSNNSNQ